LQRPQAFTNVSAKAKPKPPPPKPRELKIPGTDKVVRAKFLTGEETSRARFSPTG
jgi:hypothetical protein